MPKEVYFFITLPLALALRITRFNVPPLVVPGSSVQLTCQFDLGDEKLYSIKWYKDGVEFFRYFPSLKPQFMAFPTFALDIDISQSGPNSVFLRNLNMDSEGRYTCQVSADEPYFGCVQVHRDVVVYVPPETSPQITGQLTQHGENLTVQCSSGRSKPAANLSWYVNDIPMVSDSGSHQVTRHPDRMESSWASLNIPLKSERLPSGDFRLTCSASISDLITSVSKELVITRRIPQKILELKSDSKHPFPSSFSAHLVFFCCLLIWHEAFVIT